MAPVPAWINEELYPVPDSLRFLDAPDVSDEMKVRSWPPRLIATVALATALNVKLMPDEEADAALAPRGTYRFIEGAGHKIRWERPDRYIEELRFLDEGAE